MKVSNTSLILIRRVDGNGRMATISKRQTLLKVLFGLYFLTLFAATHLPVPELLEVAVSMYDLLFHGAAYFVLAVLAILVFCWDFKPQFKGISDAFGLKPARQAPWTLALLLIGYAALDEYLQGFVNRYPDVRDWLADSVGVFVGWGLMRVVVHCWKSPRAEYSPDTSEQH